MDQVPGSRLPEAVREMIASFPEYKMGVHRITVELVDGRVFSDVDVAWETEIIRVAGANEVPFDPAEIARVWNSP